MTSEIKSQAQTNSSSNEITESDLLKRQPSEERSWDAKLFINNVEVSKNLPFFLTRGQSHTLELQVPFLEGTALQLQSVGKDLAEADPKWGVWVNDVDGTFKWTIMQDVAISGILELLFISRELIQTLQVRGFMMSRKLSEEVKEIRLQNRTYPHDAILTRDVSQTLSYIPYTGSPVTYWPLSWSAKLITGLKPADVVFDPQPSLTTKVTAANNSGTCNIVLTGPGFTEGMESPITRVLSNDLKHEVDVFMDDVPVTPPELFKWDKPRTLSLMRKNNSPIKSEEVNVNLTTHHPLQEGDVIVRRDAGPSKLEWTVTGSNREGKFDIGLVSPIMTVPFGVLGNQLKQVRLSERMELKANGVVYVEENPDGGPSNPLKMSYGREIRFTLHPKDNRPNEPVTLTFVEGGSIIKSEIEVDPPFDQQTSLMEWSFTLKVDRLGDCALLFFSQDPQVLPFWVRMTSYV